MLLPREFDNTAPWMDRGDCAGLETAIPPREVCASCSVRRQCLAYAIAGNIREGRWGGLDVDERDLLIDLHTGDVYTASRDGSTIELRELPDAEARARAMARHPSASPEARAQLALDLYGASAPPENQQGETK